MRLVNQLNIVNLIYRVRPSSSRFFPRKIDPSWANPALWDWVVVSRVPAHHYPPLHFIRSDSEREKMTEWYNRGSKCLWLCARPVRMLQRKRWAVVLILHVRPPSHEPRWQTALTFWICAALGPQRNKRLFQYKLQIVIKALIAKYVQRQQFWLPPLFFLCVWCFIKALCGLTGFHPVLLKNEPHLPHQHMKPFPL